MSGYASADVVRASAVRPFAAGRSLVVAGAPALTALALGLWDTGRPSLWTDELVTVDVARRSPSQIWHLLGHVDAVHGLYYFLMHVVVGVAGFTPEAVRLPSVVATAFAAGALAVLGRALAGRAAGLLAGLAYACVPVVGQYALEARSYAMVAAVAVAATLALVRALRSGRPVWFVVYGALLVLLGFLHLFAILLVGAHLVTVVAGGHGRRIGLGWLVAVLGAALPLAIVAMIAATQRSAVEWIRPPDAIHLWASVRGITGSLASLVLLSFVCAVAVVRGPRSELVRVAVPWAIVPPVLLLAVSSAQPVFVARYLLFCVPAVALLAAAGLAAGPRMIMIPAGLLLLVLTAAVQPGLRRPDAKWHDVTPIVRALAQHSRAGDAFLVAPPGMRALAGAYPRAFAPMTDIALAVPGARQGSLHGSEVTGRELSRRLRGVDRVWVIQRYNGDRRAEAALRRRTARIETAGLTAPAGHWTGKRMRLTLFIRR